MGKRKRGTVLNQEILGFPVEKSIQGKFGGVETLTNLSGEPVLGKFGQPLETFTMTDMDSGEINKYWMNGGLKGAFKLAKLKTGMEIEIEETGTTTLEDWGTEIPTYKIYPLVNEG